MIVIVTELRPLTWFWMNIISWYYHMSFTCKNSSLSPSIYFDFRSRGYKNGILAWNGCRTSWKHEICENKRCVIEPKQWDEINVIETVVERGSVKRVLFERNCKLQSVTKYLRLTLVFMKNKAPCENSNCYSSGLFASAGEIFVLAGGLGNRLSFYEV